MELSDFSSKFDHALDRHVYIDTSDCLMTPIIHISWIYEFDATPLLEPGFLRSFFSHSEYPQNSQFV